MAGPVATAAEGERQPGEVSGTVADGFEPVRDAFHKTLAGTSGGASLVVRRGEEILVDLWGGSADARGTRPWKRDTVTLGFSSTKGVTATVIHRLVDRGLIDYYEPVATFWPEFAANGKEEITVRELISHRAALHDTRAIVRKPADLLDHLLLEERLAALRPAWRPGPPAYHAFNFGWLMSGLARRVTGKGMAELFRTEIAEPLGLEGLWLGRPPESSGIDVAETVGGSLRFYTTAARFGAPLWNRLPPTRSPTRALYVPGFPRMVMGANPPIWDTEMPAINGAFSGHGLAHLYAALANGGEVEGRRLLSEKTVDTIGRVQTRAVDRVLAIRMRWRLGYHHAFAIGAETRHGFGHYGYGGSGGWADPDSGLSMGFITSNVGTLTTVIGDVALLRLGGLVRRCAKQST